MYRYDNYTDSFVRIDGEPNTGSTTVRVGVPLKEAVTIKKVELTDECIDKIADAVVRKFAEGINVRSKDEPQPRCPKCGKRGYIRSLESMGVKLKVFDEYRWKCTNCNKYFKEEPKDEPQTDCAWK